ncbi:hypothetical protein [Rhodoferax saidenbachensis]|uniref:ABC-type transport auxiliary lipoprotein component domain-containing protein n=1 Tax=Rhodoferax saidenbachensis TaxID=1484693 RepID=A0ABU1ZL59_9BURK|nr:hypothetical protein [Rhodoferax saidenbachensis]MDR7306287.1 hypothetical protein [Rhodoferax saidenbachensis]
MKSISVRRVIVAAFATGAFTFALAAEPEKLALVYDASAMDVVPTILPGACLLNVVSIADQRTNQESISADIPILAGAPNVWVGNGLSSLKAYGYGVQQSTSPLPDAVNLDLELIRSYTWFGNMRINGMVAMDIGVTPVGGERKVQKFRASGSKANMWGATSEHLTTLNYAFNNVANKLALALQSACAESKTAAK